MEKNNQKKDKKNVKDTKKVSKEMPTKDTNAKPTKKKKLKLKGWVWLVLILISLGSLTYAGFHIFLWGNDNKETKKQIEDIEKIIDVEEIPADEEKDEIVNPPSNAEPASSDYWDYIKLPLISVNFDELLNKNDQTVGFIKVSGTNINYPFVQTTDNKFYLNHSFDKKYNEAGWVFLDYRNNINDLSDNSIIYAHARLDKTMFGSLRNILENNWYRDTDNYVINLSTPEYNTLWQVFSVYAIDTETYYLTTNFGSEDSHQRFIDTIVGRSAFNFNTSVNTNDKILTLSTCKNNNRKVVLHAKLIKQQARS